MVSGVQAAAEQEWREKAALQQRQLAERYGGGPCWSGDPVADRARLHQKLGLLLFGAPPEEGKMNFSELGYSKKQMKTIENIASKICKYCSGIVLMSVAFVSVRLKQNSVAQPVFKVRDRQTCKYIDPAGRVYKTWQAFLGTNRIAARELCYPNIGSYDVMEWQVEYGVSPRYSTGKRAMRAMDLTLNVGAAVAITTLLTVNVQTDSEWAIILALALVAGAILLYDLFRLALRFVDYNQHT